jgi:endogenous inhibitor of DNA gyrase (YacG/DUF329 family)
MYSPDELREIYRRLAEPFPEEAVERTKASMTRKGYDTTGLKYQYIVNRLNEVLGVGGFRVQREFSIRDKQTKNGYPMCEVTCDLVIQLGQWVDGQFQVFAEATGTGGHTSSTEADAKKGAFTNGFKKVAAFFGVGWRAYAGVIDDDNQPAPNYEPSATNHDNDWDGQNAPTENWGDQSRSNGRVTSKQIGKMRELVDELGGEWSGFRQHVTEKHGVRVEYADRKLASSLISGLMTSVRKRRGNGSGARLT